MSEQYEQMDIFGSSDLAFAEDTAINLIKTFEPVALQRCPEHGYIVGYSGGKDSEVLVHLFMRAGVKFKICHSHTTLDIPDTVYYIRKKFKEWTEQGYDCEIFLPPKSFWELCEERKMLPMRRTRFCCSELKERQLYEGAVHSFGVRKFESRNRANNRDSIETRRTESYNTNQKFHFDKSDEVKQMDMCYTNKYFIINPIAYWTTEVRDRVKSYHWKAVKLLNQHYNATVGVHVKTAVYEEWVRSGDPLDEKTLRQAIEICKVTSKLTGERGALPLIQAIEQRNLLVGGGKK